MARMIPAGTVLCCVNPDLSSLSGWLRNPTTGEPPFPMPTCTLPASHIGDHESTLLDPDGGAPIPIRWSTTPTVTSPFQTVVDKVWINKDGDLLVRRVDGSAFQVNYDRMKFEDFGTPDEWREVKLP